MTSAQTERVCSAQLRSSGSLRNYTAICYQCLTEVVGLQMMGKCTEDQSRSQHVHLAAVQPEDRFALVQE